MSSQNAKKNEELMTLREFLETVPAGEVREVAAKGKLYAITVSRSLLKVEMPEVSLYCDSTPCQGMRLHRVNQDSTLIAEGEYHFAHYSCKNCGTNNKDSALGLGLRKEGITDRIIVLKVGEVPLFGHYIPPRLLRHLQVDSEDFKKGVRAESLGLGVGAFAYYRQIVERQRTHLLSEIKKVAARLGASPEVLKEYDDAINRFQFQKSIEGIKLGIPESLLISGHNPLLLLHSALSEGIHAGTDEECLEIAASIRIVLTELANRISEALKDEAEVRNAINRLTQKKKPNP